MEGRCSRCLSKGEGIPPYWDETSILCGPCATVVAADHDRQDSWPDYPHEYID